MRRIVAAVVAVLALSGCFLDYTPDGRWTDRTTGVVVGCSEQEDEQIVPCP